MNAVERMADFTSWLQPWLAVAAVVVFCALVVTAAASRRLLTFVAATLLAALGILIPILPNPLLYVAVACSVGSLLISIATMRSHRRIATLHHRIDRLKRAVEELELDRRTQLMRAINTASPERPRLGEPVVEPQGAPPLASEEPGHAQKEPDGGGSTSDFIPTTASRLVE